MDTQETTVNRANRPAGKHLYMVVLSDDGYATYTLPEEGSIVVGRSESCDVTIGDKSVSRRHARITRGPDNDLSVIDLGSANGTRVRDTWIDPETRVGFSVGETVTFGSVLALIQDGTPPRSPRRVWPHGYFEGRVEEECLAAVRGGVTFSVLRVRAADPVADRALLDLLTETLDPADVLGRYGPGEYEALVRGADAGAVEDLQQRLIAALSSRRIEATVGASTFGTSGRSADQLLSAAASDGGTGDALLSGPVIGGAMRGLIELAGRVAQSDLGILLIGETGVGKEVMADRIHHLSLRADGPFLRLNCAALTESLLESELFGHEKGAFTGAERSKRGLLETAAGGTVFLDEIGELPLSMQVKLLRVLEERKVLRVGAVKPIDIDVRFIAATNRDLDAEVEAGRFRRDLFFRINGVTLVIPPLRQRTDEILPLARNFLAVLAARAGHAAPELSREVKAQLCQYAWPGNIRELRNIIERASVLCDGRTIELGHLPLEKMRATIGPRPGLEHLGEPTEPRRPPVASDERQAIVEALARHGGNQREAARELGIHRRTLMRRMDAYNIPRPRKKRES